MNVVMISLLVPRTSATPDFGQKVSKTFHRLRESFARYFIVTDKQMLN